MDDPLEQRTVLCRDRFGVKPLFYTLREGRLVFASEIKGLLEFPGVEPVVGPDGLRELFALGPARTPGCGVFEEIHELLPGHVAVFDRLGWRELPYFQLEACPHQEDYPHTVAHLRELLLDTVERQLQADVNHWEENWTPIPLSLRATRSTSPPPPTSPTGTRIGPSG